MKAEIVNCFIKAIKTTLHENGEINLATKSKSASNYLSLNEKVGININLCGESTLKGNVIIIIDKKIADKIIQVLMGGGDIGSVDKSMAESVFSEYANWIIASATKEIESYGERIESFKIDVKINMANNNEIVKCGNNSKFLDIKYNSNIGEAELGISI